MLDRHSRTLEIETLEDFDDVVGRGAASLSGWRLQSLDLRERTDAVRRLAAGGAAGSLFLGCRLDEKTEDLLRRSGALVFPRVPDAPVDPYRGALYAPGELYAGLAAGYDQTLDARAYSWSGASDDIAHSLVQALHDHAIDDALAEFADGTRMVGVMGGHALERDAEGYLEAAVLGRTLAREGLTVATGGGPGAMEAANLGAYLSPYDDDVLDQAVEMLATVPSFAPSIHDWATVAFEVLGRWPEGADSLGIPTWFYGHEPPNPMATRIAKYFKNAIREDILLHRCDAGIVFLPGRAGTVQEVFQDACENYYAVPEALAPMIMVGIHYWTEELPAWPLLEGLARTRPMAERIHLVDGLETVVGLLDK